jgi:sigma-B regulation protein RsbU (phosphoserine phosphatase)
VQQSRGVLWVEDLGSTNGTFVNGERVAARATVPVGGVLLVGAVAVRHELRDERAIAEDGELSGELKAAARYITELLPEPWNGRAVDVAWKLEPCRRLGGDALGYQQLDDARVAFYLIDVCGHGMRAALHSVSVLNALRQRTLPDDPADPGAMLTRLGRAFPMEAHAGMFFTIWYGVVDSARRRLRFASAGHPPALLVSGDAGKAGDVQRLALRRPPIGTAPGLVYAGEEVALPHGARLYVYSDGIIEEPGRDGRQLGVGWLERVIREPRAAGETLAGEPERIGSALRRETGARRLQDDFTLLVAHVH